MRKAQILINGIAAGILEELENGKYKFTYKNEYKGQPASLTMPVAKTIYEFNEFPPFFEGLLPEGVMLEALLHKYKLDKNDYFGQLLKVGQDVVGIVTIEELQ
jgi:serine/threonine-protein kinase HipA